MSRRAARKGWQCVDTRGSVLAFGGGTLSEILSTIKDIRPRLVAIRTPPTIATTSKKTSPSDSETSTGLEGTRFVCSTSSYGGLLPTG